MIAFPDQQYLYAWTQDFYFELNDDSGIFLVVPIGLFHFESDRFTAFCRFLVVTKQD